MTTVCPSRAVPNAKFDKEYATKDPLHLSNIKFLFLLWMCRYVFMYISSIHPSMYTDTDIVRDIERHQHINIFRGWVDRT